MNRCMPPKEYNVLPGILGECGSGGRLGGLSPGGCEACPTMRLARVLTNAVPAALVAAAMRSSAASCCKTTIWSAPYDEGEGDVPLPPPPPLSVRASARSR